MSPPIVILVIAVAAIAIFIVVKLGRAAAERERQRKAGVAAWARLNGFAIAERDESTIERRFQGAAEIGRGHDRYAFEVLHRGDPVESFLFRYHFRTTETRTVTKTDSQGRTTTRTETYEKDHWRAYCIIELGGSFPGFVIRPEHWGDSVSGFIGFNDIDFESEEFSSRYFVKSDDRQFAYALIHPQMMEWLMQQRFAAQLVKGLFLIDLSGRRFDASACTAAWTHASGFINQIPPFVWQDYGKRERVELPSAIPVSPAGGEVPHNGVNE